MNLAQPLNYSLLRKNICQLHLSRQQLIRENYFINDSEENISEPIVPMISPLQLRSYLRNSQDDHRLISIIRTFSK